MRNLRRFGFAHLVSVALLLAVPVVLHARDLSPIVSADWLGKNLNNPKVTIIDIRTVEEYGAGHVPGAISLSYNTGATKKGEPDDEIPEEDTLAGIIGSSGITVDSWVIVTGMTDTPTDQLHQTWVAWTLKYAGVLNVAVLDGGFNTWLAEKRAVSTEQVKPKGVEFKPAWNGAILAKKEYVLPRVGKSILVDTRMPDYYFGVAKLDSVARPGHIRAAVSLPSAWVFSKEGTFRPGSDLAAMASNVVKRDKSREIIVYCDTGRLASAWWWVLSEMLGYENVKLYDGSVQDWAKDPRAPLMRFAWE
jgi:thiosulfate/3-mercaptopyruvate sulfurtransferase